VVKTLCYKPEARVFKTQGDECISSIYLILPAALGPGVHSSSNRSTGSRKIMFLESTVQPVCEADNLTAICELIF
jgi:hypothetical protein